MRWDIGRLLPWHGWPHEPSGSLQRWCGARASTAGPCPTPPSRFTLSIGLVQNAGLVTNFWEWDQALVREFRVKEGQNLQFRAEAFNLTNSTRYYIAPNIGGSGGDPSTALQNPAFGTLNRTASTTGSNSLFGSGGRVVQFALKYVF